MSDTLALDLLAGFSGSIFALCYQPRMSMLRMLLCLAIGTGSAVYGAPALATVVEIQPAMERFSALAIGMTAQAYLIPGLFEAAGLLARVPAKLLRKRFGGEDDKSSG